MKHNLPSLGHFMVFSMLVFTLIATFTLDASATSQWSRKTGMSCNACHTVFPRLNSNGEEFLRNGYQFGSGDDVKAEYAPNAGDTWVDNVTNLLGFRLNMTPLMVETNSLVKDSGEAKQSRLTLGSPVWIQFFVAGPVYKDISFFSELEHASGSFKFNWFYFNLMNIAGSDKLNFQVGNISPLEFASYPDRLPQLSNIKGEVFHIKSSNGAGENSTKIRDAHGGIQYFGKHDWALWYAGISPGKSPTSLSQYVVTWGGFVAKLPAGTLEGFDGSTATIHYQTGTNTNYTGDEATPQKPQVKDSWTRIVPSINIRYNEQLDIQAAYMIAKDDNWNLVANPASDFKYSGIAFEAGYMPEEMWHFGLHYDQYAADDKIVGGFNDGKPVFEYQRIVPVVTYIINQNIRFSAYYEKDITPERKDAAGNALDLVDRAYLNMRVMF